MRTLHMLHGKKDIRASPVVLTMWSPTVQLDEEKSKNAGLAQKNSFLAPHNCTVFVVAGRRHRNSVNREKSVIN